MRKLFIIAVYLGLMAAPIAAQEEACEIDLSEVETLLEAAREAATSGDTPIALDRIAEMQDALNAIATHCAVGEIVLAETFEAPDGSFTLSYPEDWEADTSQLAESSEGVLFLGSSRAALEAALNADPDPVLVSGQQIIGILTG
jgi:hypothetical protein